MEVYVKQVNGKNVIIKNEVDAERYLTRFYGKREFNAQAKQYTIDEMMNNIGFIYMDESKIKPTETFKSPDSFVPVRMIGYILTDVNGEPIIVDGKEVSSKYESKMVRYLQDEVTARTQGIETPFSREGYRVKDVRVTMNVIRAEYGSHSHLIHKSKIANIK